jgi:sulfonate transport system substrate-binding protein
MYSPTKPLVGALALLAVAFSVVAGPASAQEKTLRIAYQKYGTLILLKATGALEERLKPLGYKVTWAEFPAGPQLIEAINVGAIDFGSTGEAPPIFAQAAGVPLSYVAHEPPAPQGEAILVPKGSPIQGVTDLKGKKVALNKGSNVHYLLVKALEKAGVAYADIQPVFLPPADARAAFEKGAVDAWAIWDPFQAAAEVAIGARTLVNGEGLVPNHQFYLGASKFVADNPVAVEALVAAIGEVDRSVAKDPEAAAAQLSPGINIPPAVLAVALKRQSFGVKPLDPSVVAEQQKIADTFLALGLLPKPVVIADAVRKPAS